MHSPLEPLLDSWDRNNTILVNLLRLIPEESMRAGNPSVAEMFAHVHYVRLVFVQEDAPEFARELPSEEWTGAYDRARMEQMLNESAAAVREAVKSYAETGREMRVHFDHPILFMQQMIWHEGYHHGQIKLALKTAGLALPDSEAGPGSWGVWMKKTR